MSGRSKPECEDRGAYLPGPDEIKSRAAKIREDWSPRQMALRGGEYRPPSIPEYHSPDLPGVIQEILSDARR